MTRRRYFAGLCLATLAAAGAGALPAAARDRAVPGWRIVKIAGSPERGADFNSVVSSGPANAWAAGTDGLGLEGGGVFLTPNALLEHWNVTAWRRVRVPVRLIRGLGGVETISSSSARNTWIFGINVVKVWTLRYDGATWTKTMLPTAMTKTIERGNGGGAVTFGPDNAWIISGGHAFHYARHSWHEMRLPAGTLIRGLDPVSARDMWVLGRYSKRQQRSGNRYVAMHWNGSSWQPVPMGHLRLPSVSKFTLGPWAASGPRNLWAVGNLLHAPFLLNWAGPTRGWTRVSIPAGTSSIDGAAADGNGGVWLYASLENGTWEFFHYQAGAWTTYHVPTVPGGFTQVFSMNLIPGTHSIWAAGTSLARSATKSLAVVLKYGS
jgi:hypothetical protein